MAVRKNFKFRVFSEEEFKQLERDAAKFENLAKRKERAKVKLRQRGGVFGEGDTTTNLPKSFVRKQDKLLLEREKTPTKGKNTKGAIIREDAIDKIKKQLTEQQKDLGVLKKLFGRGPALVQGAISNPIGAGIGGLTSVIGKFLPIGIVISIAALAVDMWIKSYGKGGTNDPRKKILDDVFTLIGLEEETNILAGTTFFANSRTLFPNQEVVSNTQNLRDGERRTRLLNVGYGRV